MIHRFGAFELDEDARSLHLNGADQKVQPLVFDLLAHLLRNAGRVVPKDELMDALWPDVIVTEASLQRLVSLARRALEPGGMGDAIRSFVRHGYRFALDRPGLGHLDAMTDPVPDNRIEAADLARLHDWAGLVQRFEALDGHGGLGGADLDLWAFAVECRGRPFEAIPVLIRGVAAHLAEDRPELAARAAVTIAKLELERSAPAAAAGWLDRAEALAGSHQHPRLAAYLLWMRSRLATFSGRADEALSLSMRASEAARICGDAGLIALTLTYEGFYNIALGDTAQGIDQQNHAAAIALSSQVDPVTGSLVYCNILWSCRTFSDWARARQWSIGFETWCAASFAEVPGSCDLHRAEILGTQRRLPEALQAIETAIPKLSDEEAFSIGEGYRVRGDLRAMMGDLDGARADYAAAYASGWDAEPGNAFLLAETGQHESALAALDRTLSGASWYHLQRRGMLLAHKARIAALAGRGDVARAALDELQSQPGRWSQPAAHALMNEARYWLDPEDPEAARFLMLARQLWTGAGIEYHAARVRLDLARLYLRAGDEMAARAEISACLRSAERIGSPRLQLEAGALAAPVTN